MRGLLLEVFLRMRIIRGLHSGRLILGEGGGGLLAEPDGSIVNLSTRENLVVTSAYAGSYRLRGRARGSQGNPTGVENAIFSWWEIAWCFWATSIFLGGDLHDRRRL